MDVTNPNVSVYTEADWNYGAVNEIRAKEEDSSGWAIYGASKTLAEQGKSFLLFKG
jgi:hypothetical protein